MGSKISARRELVATCVFRVVVENAGDGVGGVGGFRGAGGVEEFFGVAVVGGDDEHAAKFVDAAGEAGEGEVEGFEGDDGGVEIGEVTDHVAVGVVDADKIRGVVGVFEPFEDGVGDFGGFHPGALNEGAGVGGDFLEGFAWVADVGGAVEIVGDVAEFGGFTDGELGKVGGGKGFGEGVADFDGFDEALGGEVSVGVIFGEADKS